MNVICTDPPANQQVVSGDYEKKVQLWMDECLLPEVCDIARHKTRALANRCVKESSLAQTRRHINLS